MDPCEVHLSSATGLLAMLQKAIHAILSRFKDALRVYEAAMGEELSAEDVTSALIAAELPRVHSSAIGARTEAEASRNALLTRGATSEVTTTGLAREVGPRLRPFTRGNVAPLQRRRSRRGTWTLATAPISPIARTPPIGARSLPGSSMPCALSSRYSVSGRRRSARASGSGALPRRMFASP